MAIIRTLALLQHDSGLPEDTCVNTFHHSTAASPPLAADVTAAQDQIEAFYNAAPVGFTPLRTVLSPLLSGQVTLKSYDLGAPEPRPPIATRTFTMVLNTGNSLPMECAMTLSYRATPTAGVDPKSARGRLYIGPLLFSATEEAAFDRRPTLVARQHAVDAAVRMANAGETATATWVVYSAKRASLGLSPSSLVAQHFYVDDALDTQRRRGRAASTRTSSSSV